MAVALVPLTVDRAIGADHLVNLAAIHMLVGELDTAVDEVEYLLSIPSLLTPEILRLDPRWHALNQHPRFESVLNK